MDFSSLLDRNVEDIKRPPALPAGDYPAVIKNKEFGDNNKNKTPYVRFAIGLTGWPEEVDSADRQFDGKPIDLSKKTFRKDYYLTEDSLWRLKDFLEALGLGGGNRKISELIDECIGQPVIAQVEQYINQKNSEIGNQIGDLRAAS